MRSWREGGDPRAMPARAALRDHSVNARVPPAHRDKPGRRTAGPAVTSRIFPGRGWAVYSPKLAVLIK
ncbi:hypothetical protein GCM10022285_25650 [Streptomyces tunisiensis]|uniref:Uncharacterized protein n=1 Tax=Streptomyces tunisiensis TaxID=948699 RepID=A0ABP7YC93_9ACTN